MTDQVSKAQAMRRVINQLKHVRDGYIDNQLTVEAMSIQAMIDVRIEQLDAYIAQNFPIVEIRGRE